MKYRNMKFAVANEEQCELLQKVLFDIGYTWCDSGQDVFYEKKINYIYADEDGILTYGESNSVYESTDSIPIDVSWMHSQYNEIIDIAGVKYRFGDIEQALKAYNIKPV